VKVLGEIKVAGFFYQLGKMAGPKVRKAKWILRSLTGTEAEAIQAEYEVGRDLAKALAVEMQGVNDPHIAQLLDELGSRLSSRVKNRQRRFEFRAVESPHANAFALPGGFICVTRSLLELCEFDPHELAFILGHEMSHVIRKHAMDRLMTNSILDTAIRAAPVGGLFRSQIGGILRNLLEQSYSQDQELDADELGVRLAHSAGFDVTAAVRLMTRLKQTSGSAPGLSEYFSSHPPFDLRIKRIERALKC
jgi:predicted Zn-dependent protease